MTCSHIAVSLKMRQVVDSLHAKILVVEQVVSG